MAQKGMIGAALAACCVGSIGCQVDVPDMDSGRFACATDDDCVAGFVCGAAGSCVSRDASGEDCLSGDCEEPVVLTDPVSLQGAAHKGPLVLGSSIAVSPVRSDGSPLGEVFRTNTANDLGEFEVQLRFAGYVSLEASGFYYNEVTGELSTAPLTLRAFGHVSQQGTQSVFVNLITHLIYARAKNLVRGGAAFQDAIATAETELYEGLGIGNPSQRPTRSATETELVGWGIRRQRLSVRRQRRLREGSPTHWGAYRCRASAAAQRGQRGSGCRWHGVGRNACATS